jgi:hypothetical protein
MRYRVADILKYRPKVLPFEGEWLESFGTPELGGCWLIWGNSGNGKTRFTLQLCKYLARFGRVAYCSLEEGLSLSFQTAIRSVGMQDVSRRFVMLDKVSQRDLRARLEAKRSPDVVVIDSVQYSGLDKDSAKALVDDFPRKLFLFISHAEGRLPAGRTASAIRFHAGVKLHVEGYRISAPVSRFKDGACAPFTIWSEGAERYWGGYKG